MMSNLDSTDKILLLTAGMLVATGAIMIHESKKYEETIQTLKYEVDECYHMNNKILEEVIVGNQEIDNGNKLMRQIIKKSLEEGGGLK